MKSCLVVDDSKTVRKVVSRIIEELGFSTAEAEDGQSALEACGAAMPDLIMLDWNMPVMSGIDFLKALRALPDGGKPKVIFCTTEAEIERISEALTLGADEYIMKPFDKEIIAGKLSQVGFE